MLMSPSQFSSLHLVSNNLVTCFGELFSCAQLLPSRLRIIVTCNGRTNISLLIFKWARCSRWRATNQPGIDASALWLGVGGNGCMFGLAFVSECSCVSVCECWIGKSLWAVSRVDFFRHHYSTEVDVNKLRQRILSINCFQWGFLTRKGDEFLMVEKHFTLYFSTMSV